MLRRIGPVQSVAAVERLEPTVRRTDLVPDEQTGGIERRRPPTSTCSTRWAARWRRAAGSTRRRRSCRRSCSARRRPSASASIASTPACRSGSAGAGSRSSASSTRCRWRRSSTARRSSGCGVAADAARRGRHAVDASTCGRSRSDVEAVRDVLRRHGQPGAPRGGRGQPAVRRPRGARRPPTRRFTALLLGLGAVALLVGGIGIANVMVIAVLERRREIGLRRALGATRRHMLVQFLLRVAVSWPGSAASSGALARRRGRARLRVAAAAGRPTSRRWASPPASARRC